MKVELFIPCYIDQFFPDTAFNTIKVLQKAGCDVHYHAIQTCCGRPAFDAGYWDDAKAIGSKFLNDFAEEDIIVTPSAVCTGMVRNNYTDLFTNTIAHNKCRTVQGNIYELSDFLVNILQFDYFGAELEGRAVYHDSCNALRECKIKEEPRQLLSKVYGLDMVKLNSNETCCGFGGAFSVRYEAIASSLAQQKIEDALAVHADYIISTDYACLMHLQGYINHNDLPIKTMHIADVLANGWGNI